jgi:ribosomal-protein-alanine N-acetyltransferase
LRLIRHTRRLTIRPLRLSDYRAWARAHRARRPARNPWDHGPLPEKQLSRAAFAKRVRRQRRGITKDRCYHLAIFDRRTGEHLGAIDFLIYFRDCVQWANLGYHIHNHRWGNGYAREAARAGLNIAFRELRLQRVEAGIDPPNRASLAVARALRMRREGVRKAFLYSGGRWRDLVIFATTAPGAPRPEMGLRR